MVSTTAALQAAVLTIQSSACVVYRKHQNIPVALTPNPDQLRPLHSYKYPTTVLFSFLGGLYTLCPQEYTIASPSSLSRSKPAGAPYCKVAMRGGLVLAGVLLLVTLLSPVEEDTDGACGFGGEIGAGTARSLTARCLLELVDLRFSLDSLVWLVLVRGVERRVVKEGRLELLVGVLGVAKSSSWKPLNLESYDRCVPRVELRTPLPVRVGVEGEFRLKDRKDDFGVMASEGTAVADRTRRPDELPGRTERPDELLGRTGRPDELLGLLV
jgi:hypothetical protein